MPYVLGSKVVSVAVSLRVSSQKIQNRTALPASCILQGFVRAVKPYATGKLVCVVRNFRVVFLRYRSLRNFKKKPRPGSFASANAVYAGFDKLRASSKEESSLLALLNAFERLVFPTA